MTPEIPALPPPPIPPCLGRRTWLLRALQLCAGAGLLGPLLACEEHSALDTYADPSLWEDVPRGYVSSSNLTAAQDIGATYLREAGRDRDLATLQAAVKEASALLTDDMPEDAMLMAVQHAIADDFDKNTTVTVAGWVLSRTEAQLCALLFLNRGSA